MVTVVQPVFLFIFIILRDYDRDIQSYLKTTHSEKKLNYNPNWQTQLAT